MFKWSLLVFVLWGCDPGEDRACLKALSETPSAATCDCVQEEWGHAFRLCTMRLGDGRTTKLRCSAYSCQPALVCSDPDCTSKEIYGVRQE